MARVLVVGGSGFVGRAIVKAFLGHDCRVAVLNRGTHPVAGTEQFLADRNDPVAMRAALEPERFDVVIDTNCYRPDQARILLDALRSRAPRLVMISSAAVYADRAGQPPLEVEPTGGASIWGAYGRDKSEAERVYAEVSPFERIVLIRPPYIFGPGNNLERETWFWARQVHGQPVLLPGQGTARVQFIHEDDLASAAALLALGPGKGLEVFNVADPEILTLSGLATMLAGAAGVADRQVLAGDAAAEFPARSWFPFRDAPCLADPTCLLSKGWRPAAPLARRFAETYRDLRDRTQIRPSVLSDIEIQILSRLPSAAQDVLSPRFSG